MFLLSLVAACEAPEAERDPVWSPWGPTGIEVDCRGTCTLVCVGAGERWAQTATDDTITWSGLIAGETYACALDRTHGRTSFFVAVPDLPPGGPVATISGVCDGLTLFNHARDGADPRLVVMDGEGRIRWWHDLPADTNAGVEATWHPETPFGPSVFAGGGDTVPPRFITRDGLVAWSGPPVGVAGGVWHHDAAWLPDRGAIVGLSEAENVGAGDKAGAWTGFALETIEPVAGLRPWWWTSQEAVDAGALAIAAGDSDPYHANSVQWMPDDPDGPSYWISLKRREQIVRLSEAGVLDWALGVGGDFELSLEDGTPGRVTDWFWGQHAPEAMPTGDPNRWTLLVHDNGMGRPNAPLASRALQLDLDLAARTATVAWSWTESGWYEPVYGEVDRLPSGNVLVAMGHCPGCNAVATDRKSSIVEVDPTTDLVVWRADLSPSESIYRAERLDPCTWMPHNEALCPAVTDAQPPPLQ